MGHYRKIDTKIWNDAWFRSLPDDAKLAFFFILTHPDMTSMGCMRATESGLAEDFGKPLKAFREALREALAKGSLKASWKDRFLCVPGFMKYNKPESPNVVKSWVKIIDMMPECHMRDAYFNTVKGYLEGFGKAFTEALPKGFGEGYAESGTPTLNSNSELQLDTPKPPQGAECAFEDFWKAYPKKKGKGAALKIWKRLKPSKELTAKILEAVSAQSRSTDWLKENGQYIPHPTTWLNQGRWDDETEIKDDIPMDWNKMGPYETEKV